MRSNESSENYLETILMLSKRLPVVRAVDIANELGFKKSSVSIAMKNLRENGYIDVMGDGTIVLLSPGKEIAEKLYNRHTILTEYLRKLGVSESTAAEDACKIEHIISDESFEAIKASLTK